ncbi:KaiC domain-containing protein [Halovenus marina]|uniref:KaiC domain-containing protein n=1 Tax=Halovenus marina TaxID=3396621 RepID=UPI003F54C910
MSEDESSEEDWFERAFQEDDSAEQAASDADEGGWDESDRETASTDETPETGDEGGPFDEEIDTSENPFGASDETSENPFGGGDESLFDDEGFGSLGGGESEFDEAEFDSDIDRLDIGIQGLDDMILGGVPKRHLITAVGSAGTGKTTFGLQFLNHGLQQGEPGVFITLEQSREDILATANEWGWDFAAYEDSGDLAIVDLDPVEMVNSLNSIQSELPQLVRDFGADRLVLDSVSLLEMMYEDVAKRRTEVFDFTRALKKANVTTFVTSEASESNAYASRHGIIEYLTDAVFILQYVRGESQETRLAVEILKIRNANHSREMKPYELTDDGISVYRNATIF